MNLFNRFSYHAAAVTATNSKTKANTQNRDLRFLFEIIIFFFFLPHYILYITLTFRIGK